MNTPDPATTPSLLEWSVTWTADPLLKVTPPSLAFQAAADGPEPALQTLPLENMNGGELPCGVPCACALGRPLPLRWSISDSELPDRLVAEPISGTVPATLTVTASVAGWLAGVYTATLRYDGPLACVTCPVDVPVTLTLYDVPALAVTPLALNFEGAHGGNDAADR